MRKMTAIEVMKLTSPGTHRVDDALYLQVKAGRSWLHRYTKNGKSRWAGLGPYPQVSLAEARAARDEQRAMLRKGIDPVAARQAEKAAETAKAIRAVTFKDCAKACMEAREAGWRSAEHAAQWKRSLEVYVYPLIGDLPVASIDTAAAMQVLEPIWQRIPETACRVRSRCEIILDWAKAREYRSGENPFRGRGHIAMLLPAKAKIYTAKHHEAMPFADVPVFMAALRSRQGFATRALELLILTALRTNEVIGAKWDEFDLAKRVWTVPAKRMKAGKQHCVPLSPAACRVVEQMAAIRSCEFVFPGTRGHISRASMLHVLSRMGENESTPHGFRSTFRDWAGDCTAFDRETIEFALAHGITDATEAAYRRGTAVEKRRRLMDTWAEYCGLPAGQENRHDENVVSLRASA